MAEQTWGIAMAAAASAGLCVGLIVLFKPLLHRYVLAHPNSRSSHAVATPQGGGIAVMLAVLIVIAGTSLIWPELVSSGLGALLLGAAGLTILGAIDDARNLPVGWRLLGQALAATLMVLMLPAELRALPDAFPLVLERALLVLGTVALINAVNFLDGLDWMTVAEVVPILVGCAGLYALGRLPPDTGLLALALLGAMLGFAAFNKHPAKIFLGDAGSLPLGLCLAYLLIGVAGIDVVAALLFALYIIADSTITLGRRFAKGEPVMMAHRTHFYQRAVDMGLTPPQVTARIFALGVLLAFFAVAAAAIPARELDLMLLIGGCCATALLLYRLGQGR